MEVRDDEGPRVPQGVVDRAGDKRDGVVHVDDVERAAGKPRRDVAARARRVQTRCSEGRRGQRSGGVEAGIVAGHEVDVVAVSGKEGLLEAHPRSTPLPWRTKLLTSRTLTG